MIGFSHLTNVNSLHGYQTFEKEHTRIAMKCDSYWFSQAVNKKRTWCHTTVKMTRPDLGWVFYEGFFCPTAIITRAAWHWPEDHRQVPGCSPEEPQFAVLAGGMPS
jgi:hypothetical protein